MSESMWSREGRDRSISEAYDHLATGWPDLGQERKVVGRDEAGIV